MTDQTEKMDLNRRDFLKGGSMASMMAMVASGATAFKPAAVNAQDSKPLIGPPVKFGIIGCGYHGRDVLGTLAVLPNAPVVAICDHYGAFLRRAGRTATEAKRYENYKDLLADENVEAVVVVTPSHQHKDIVIDALKAGKHVYCEAPLASSIEDARAIAMAAKHTPKQYFQAGLQFRSDPQRHFLVDYVRTGAWGHAAFARSQWHKKTSWKRAAPTDAREREINWRLSSATSSGLIGEIGIHQLDANNWFLGGRPSAVTGFGSTVLWKDGRDIPDTTQVNLEYDKGVNSVFDITLCNSFDTDYEMYYGTEAALMIRGSQAWLFKEADAPMLGWEVYAKKDTFHKEVGIYLVANATKLTTVTGSGDDAAKDNPFNDTPLYYALENFVHNAYVHQAGVEDFIASFGEVDDEMLGEYLMDLEESKKPAAGYQEGFEANVVAVKAHQAVLAKTRLEINESLYELG
jgi:predicted dehydrogenase